MANRAPPGEGRLSLAAEPQRDHQIPDGREVVGRPLSPRAAAFYDAVWDSARRGCLGLLRQCGASEGEAEEVFAEVFTIVMSRVDPVKREFAEAQMVNLLKVSCRRRWIDERRHRAVLREVALTDAESIGDSRQEDPDELVERIEEIEVGKEAVLSLPERDQKVFRLRYQLDLSPDEIQERLPGLSARAYRRTIQRASARVLSAYERIEKGERCEELQTGLLKKFVVGDAPAPEVVAVEAHLRHCRSCQIACQQMHEHLRDVGSSLAIVVGAAGGSSAPTTSEITHQLVGQADSIGSTTQGVRDRFRDLLLRIPGVGPGGGGEAPLGQVIGVSGKLVAACAGGAAAAACTAALVVPTLDVFPSKTADPGQAPVSRPPAAASLPDDEAEPLRRAIGDAPDKRKVERSTSSQEERARSQTRETWTSKRGPVPKPRSKAISSGQETGTELGLEANGTGSPVSPAEVEAAGSPPETSASTTGGSSTAAPSGGGGSSGGGSAEFGM